MKLLALLIFFGSIQLFALDIPTCGHVISVNALRSFNQVAEQLHGGNQREPRAGSLIRQYLSETGAVTFRHRFSNGIGGTGPEKLVVLVSPESFPTFRRLFAENNPNLFEHLHNPGQGTLMVRWMNLAITYAYNHSEYRFPTVGSIGPMILLSDSETLRLRDYFELNKTGQARFRYPDQITGFNFPKDGYSGNCTTWIGFIPLADQTSSRVVVAGSVDDYGDRQGQAPREGVLSDYSAEGSGVDAALLNKVWNPNLHGMLWPDVLGIPMSEAIHTNPGWVAISLTARARDERVPFVALYTNNHTVIPDPFNPAVHPVGP
ncbi:MAG: hypothetical protein HY537_02745 [Deltaproteobacteria bacterium]|nr:hypothetical protein [Deltaproteobacteria bacterium]